MRNLELLQEAIGLIDDELIIAAEEAPVRRKRVRPWRLIAIAAAITLLAALTVVVVVASPYSPPERFEICAPYSVVDDCYALPAELVRTDYNSYGLPIRTSFMSHRYGGLVTAYLEHIYDESWILTESVMYTVVDLDDLYTGTYRRGVTLKWTYDRKYRPLSATVTDMGVRSPYSPISTAISIRIEYGAEDGIPSVTCTDLDSGSLIYSSRRDSQGIEPLRFKQTVDNGALYTAVKKAHPDRFREEENFHDIASRETSIVYGPHGVVESNCISFDDNGHSIEEIVEVIYDERGEVAQTIMRTIFRNSDGVLNYETKVQTSYEILESVEVRTVDSYWRDHDTDEYYRMSHRVVRFYDRDGRLSRSDERIGVGESASRVVDEYRYDEVGRRSTITTRGYNSSGLLLDLDIRVYTYPKATAESGPTVTLTRYDYDESGNLIDSYTEFLR